MKITGALVLLQLLLIGFKLADKLSYSWWLVLIPGMIYLFFKIMKFFILWGLTYWRNEHPISFIRFFNIRR